MMRFAPDAFAGGRRSFLWKLLLLLPILAALTLYRVIGHNAHTFDPIWIVKLPIDDLIPFVASFAYAYFFWYIYSYGTIFLLFALPGAGRSYRRYTLSMAVTLAIALGVFLAFPTHMVRPEILGNSLADDMMRLVFSVDPPYNCLPSIHVAFSVLTLLELEELLSRSSGIPRALTLVLRLANGAVAVLICLSTLLVKQHYSPDLFAGIAVALTARWGVSTAIRRWQPDASVGRA